MKVDDKSDWWVKGEEIKGKERGERKRNWKMGRERHEEGGGTGE